MNDFSKPTLKNFYFTFGCGMKPYNENYYHVVPAKNESVAREIMFDRFGDNWSFVYKSAADAGVQLFGLEEVPWPLPDENTIADIIFT